jgi:2-keto-4-pentenoate hydratase/2-oxohepta-3-ene-1,7-dioic acid hydratase in catechol pathway
MKLCTFRNDGPGRVGVVLNGDKKVADITIGYAALLKERGKLKAREIAAVLTPSSMLGLIEAGEEGLAAVKELKAAAEADPNKKGPDGENLIFDVSEIRVCAPLSNPSKILCPALTHKQGFDKVKRPPGVEPHPVYFIKLPSCITGPFDPIEIPDIGVVGSEVEIAAILSRKGKNISKEQARSYIFGYTVVNDITAHDLRTYEDWIIHIDKNGNEEKLTYAGRYKCYDTWAPMGPWLVTPDEIDDIMNLDMQAKQNDIILQEGNTNELVYTHEDLIAYMSQFHTFFPGDIILSGTVKAAAGRHILRDDLKTSGGVLESSIQGLGVMRNPIKAV